MTTPATTSPRTPYTDAQRMELRSLVLLAGETVAPFWPMRTFIHHNPLHGLEELDFEEAVERGRHLFGGEGYLPAASYRELLRNGTISLDQLHDVLAPLATDASVELVGQAVVHRDVLAALMAHGLRVPMAFQMEAVSNASPDRALLDTLSRRLEPTLEPRDLMRTMLAAAHGDRAKLAHQFTLGDWCDATFGTDIRQRIDRQLTKWCAAFLDEGHAAWEMPLRDTSFYGAWHALASMDHAGELFGLSDWQAHLATLPTGPEDAILESLNRMGIPKALWSDYLTLHLCALPGWTGFIRWRAEHGEQPWQRCYPIDRVQYLAVRLVYEREWVAQACEQHLGWPGTFQAIADWIQNFPEVCYLRRERTAGHLSLDTAREIDRLLRDRTRTRDLRAEWVKLIARFSSRHGPTIARRDVLGAAWRLVELAKAMRWHIPSLAQAEPTALRQVLGWIEHFPEDAQGPYWLRALERSYQERLVQRLAPRVTSVAVEPSEPACPVPVRPFAQSVFCIDVRSEYLRRHLERIGDHATFGIAGFFGLPIRYQPFGERYSVDLCPVLVKPKHGVREVPRAYQGRAARKHLAVMEFVRAVEELFHDLKENVITPYVMVEAAGWLFGIPFLFKTLLPLWYQRLTAWIQHRVASPVETTLTVDKLSRKEATEMVAMEQRATLRRALRDRLGPHTAVISSELVESLRIEALEEDRGGITRDADRWGLSSGDRARLIADLRNRYQLNPRAAAFQLDRITKTGFTLNEQALFVETAFRLIGLTEIFARIVLFCGHGSTSENNPYESALDCGACGGNHGSANARALAAIANRPSVREELARRGIVIPADTHFCAALHDTTTDHIRLFDLEDIPPTHRHDLGRLLTDLEEAADRVRQERCARLPDIGTLLTPTQAATEALRRSVDWSQVRPEWGLSRNGVMIIGRRELTTELDLEGRAFLHSYDFTGDPTGRLLEIIMTAPLVVAQWINMEHYFSTVDNEVYGSGSKVYHNVVGRIGVMYGTESDLRIGLTWQTVMDGTQPYHEPMRLLALIEAPRDRIDTIIGRNEILQRLFGLRWVHLIAVDPQIGTMWRRDPNGPWIPIDQDRTSLVQQEKGGAVL